MDFTKDKYCISGKVIYLYYSNGMGRSKMTNTVLEKKLDCEATTRNWRTMCKIQELLRG